MSAVSAVDPEIVLRVARWATGLRPQDVVVLTCDADPEEHHQAPPEAATPVPDAGRWPVRWPGCLTLLSVADLLTLAAAAPHLQIQRCDHPDRQAADPAWAPARALLERFGVTERLSVTAAADPPVAPAPPAASNPSRSTQSATPQSLPVPRRSLFAWLHPRGGDEGPTTTQQAGHEAAPGVQREQAIIDTDRLVPEPVGTGAVGGTNEPPGDSGSPGGPAPPGDTTSTRDVAPDDDQRRIVAALREISRQHGLAPHGAGPPHAAPPESQAARTPRSRAQLLTSSGCTACGTCVRACPTSALALAADDGQPDAVSLALDTAACISCQHCVAICPAQALAPDQPLDWEDLVTGEPWQVLEELRVQQCRRCRTDFAGTGELCQVCAMRRQNPFGSWMPPGLVAPRVYAPQQPDRHSRGVAGDEPGGAGTPPPTAG